MIKRLFTFIILALFVANSFSLTAQETKKVQKSEMTNQRIEYQVKELDTLWGIAAKFLNDPFLWPYIWNKNPFIKDPHWIYPGSIVIIPSADEIYRLTHPEEEKPVVIAPPVEQEPVVKEVPNKFKLIAEKAYLQIPFVAEKELDESVEILSLYNDPSTFASLFSEIEIENKYNFETGDILFSYKKFEKVEDPKNFQSLGKSYVITATLKILEATDGKAKAKVIALYDRCQVGDLAAKYDNLEVPEFENTSPATSEYDSYIVSKIRDTAYLAPFDFIFVNKTEDMKVGQVYQIIKENVSTYDPFKKSTVELPFLAVGKVKILRLDEHTATAIVSDLYDNTVGTKDKLTLFSEAY